MAVERIGTGIPPTDLPKLPISKLRGVEHLVRTRLKRRRINTCAQLLVAAATPEQREALALAARIPVSSVLELAKRADMARVSGIGAIFGLMLELVGVDSVDALARQDPRSLHERVRAMNSEGRLARRSPTPEEIESWVMQARKLPPVLFT